MAVEIIGSKSPEQLTMERLIGELVGGNDVQTRIGTILTNLGTVDTVVDGIQADLDNGTDGLGALKSAIVGVQSSLDNGTYGLSAIKGKANDIETDTQDIQSKIGTPAGASVSADVAAVKSDTAANKATLESGTYGLSAIKTQTAAIEVDTQDLQSKVGTPAGASVSADIAAVKTVVDDNNGHLESGTYGLAVTKTAVDNVYSRVGAPVGATISADIAAVKSQTGAIETDTQDIQSKIGTPAGASVSADIANVYSRVGAPAGASISADIAALKAVADNINNSTRCAASIAGLLEIPEAGSSSYRVQANIFDAAGLPQESDSDAVYYRLIKADGSTLASVYFSDAGLTTPITAEASGDWTGWYAMDTTPVGRAFAWVGISSAAVQQGLTLQIGYKLDTNTIVVERSTQTVNYLQAAGQAGVTADAVWDEAAADHTSTGSTGKYLTDILGDTNELQTDWANGGRLDLLVDAILADTNELQTDLANGGRLDLLIDAILEDTGTTLPGILGTPAGASVSADIAAVKSKADDIYSRIGAPAGASVSADIAVIDGLQDVPSADSANNAQMRDVIGNKTDTVAGGSLVGLVKKVQATLDNEQAGGTIFRAAKTTGSVAQAANETLNIAAADGFDCINAMLTRIAVTVTGDTTNYTVEIFEKSDGTKLLWKAIENAGDDIVVTTNLTFTNQNGSPSKNIYVKITNNTDTGNSSFAVELRGLKMADALA